LSEVLALSIVDPHMESDCSSLLHFIILALHKFKGVPKILGHQK